MFIYQYLEGNAASWAKPILTEKDLELQSDWTKFLTAFHEQFQDSNIHDHLTEQLYSLKQTKSIKKYTSHFENLVHKTN